MNISTLSADNPKISITRGGGYPPAIPGTMILDGELVVAPRFESTDWYTYSDDKTEVTFSEDVTLEGFDMTALLLWVRRVNGELVAVPIKAGDKVPEWLEAARAAMA